MARTRGGRRRSPSPVEVSDAEGTDVEELDGQGQENVVSDDEATESEKNEAVAEPTEETISPVRFHFKHRRWLQICKIATRCDLQKTVRYLEEKLSVRELNWFKNHDQFKHYFHMPLYQNRKIMGMWMLLLRTVDASSLNQCWFVVNGHPIRYSIVEHALISGLNCRERTMVHNDFGSFDFVQRCFGRERRIDIIDIKKKLDSMDADDTEDDRLKLAVLYFLTTVIKGKSKIKGGYIEPFLLKIVDNLAVCRTYPWGSFSFHHIMEEVDHLIEHFDGRVQSSWTFPGFLLALEVLAFECIPSLDQKFRKDVIGADPSCPRLCKRKFKRLNHKAIALGEIYEALGSTKNIIEMRATADELPLMERILDDDPDAIGDNIPESWLNTFSGEGFYWKDLYRKDVATRAEFVEEDQPAEDGEDAEVSKESMNVKLEEMRNQFEVFKEEMRNQVVGLKKEMKTLVASLVEAEIRKRTAATGSSYYEGGCSTKEVVEDENAEDENAEEGDEGETAENAPGHEDAENATEDEDAATPIGHIVRRLRKRRKKNSQN